MAPTGTDIDRYAIDDLILDVGLVRLQRGDQSLPLQGLTFDLLVCLARHAPLVVSKDTIFTELWPGAHVGEETLKQRVRLLRKALGDDSRSPRYVETVRGRGYRLVCQVTRLAQTEPVLPASPTPRPLPRPRFTWLLLLIGLAGLMSWWFFAREQSASSHVAKASLSTASSSPAEELYQRAYDYYRRYLPRDNETAIQLLQQAVALDPGHARALALLSRAYSQQPKLGNGHWGEAAKDAATRAIEADPDDPDGYVALGLFHDVGGRTSTAIQVYRQVLERWPDHPTALANAAYGLMMQGQLLEALAWNQRALQGPRQLQFGRVQMGDTLHLLGLDDPARAWLEKATTLQPDNLLARVSFAKFLLLAYQYEAALDQISQVASYGWGEQLALNCQGDICFFKGDLRAAQAAFQQTWATNNLYGGYRLALVLAQLEDDTATEHIAHMADRIHDLIQAGSESAEHRLALAALKALQGDAQATRHWLDEAIRSGFRHVRWLSQDPGLTALRATSGFHQRQEALSDQIAKLRAQVDLASLNPS